MRIGPLWLLILIVGALLVASCGGSGKETAAPTATDEDVAPVIPTTAPTREPTAPPISTPTATPILTPEPASTTTPTETSEAQGSIAGLWEGVEVWSGREFELIVEFVFEGEDLKAFRISHGDAVPLENVSFDSPTVHFEIGANGEVSVIYDGELRGDTITGEASEFREHATFTLKRVGTQGEVVTSEPGLSEAEQQIVGHWEGAELWPEGEVEIIVDFAIERGRLVGLITAPQQGVSRVLVNLRVDFATVHFEPGGTGQGRFDRIYDGDIVGDTISGESVRSGESAPFTLKRVEAQGKVVVLEPGLNVVTLDHDGRVRRLLVQLPDAFQPDVSYPVLFWFHGRNSTGDGILEPKAGSDLLRLVNTEGFVGVFPDAFGPAWNNCFDTPQRCEEFRAELRNIGFFFTTADDVGFTEAILDWLAMRVTVDEARVYATGWSSGAAMVQGLALFSDRFAAIAPIGGGGFMGGQTIPEFPTLSVIQVWGERDAGYEAVTELGVVGLSALDTNALWAQHNGCSTTPEVDTSQPGITTYRYTDCDDSRQVLLYAVREGQHWPGRAVDGQPVDPPGDIFELIWDFFERNARPR